MVNSLGITWMITGAIADLFGIWMLYTFYIFIKTVKDEKSSKSIIRSAYVCLITAIIAIFAWSLERYGEGLAIEPLRQSASATYITCFAVQMTSLLIYFYCRLNYIFKGTQYELSKYTVRFFISLFIIQLILWFGIIAITFITKSNMLNGIVLVFIMNALTILCLSFLLIRKLLAVYKIEQRKGANNSNNNMISAITKTVILNTTWTVFTILDLMGIFIYTAWGYKYASVDVQSVKPEGHIVAVFVGIVAISDMFANYFAVLSSFKAFKNYYDKLCKCPDNQCKKCVNWCINNETETQRKVVVMNNVSNADNVTVENEDGKEMSYEKETAAV